MIRDDDIPTFVTLEQWVCRVYGDRYTLTYGGKTLTTWPTEFEARAYARRMGWQVALAEGDRP